MKTKDGCAITDQPEWKAEFLQISSHVQSHGSQRSHFLPPFFRNGMTGEMTSIPGLTAYEKIQKIFARSGARTAVDG
jgi:hypothetical protein